MQGTAQKNTPKPNAERDIFSPITSLLRGPLSETKCALAPHWLEGGIETSMNPAIIISNETDTNVSTIDEMGSNLPLTLIKNG
jgi:hypothetical protein